MKVTDEMRKAVKLEWSQRGGLKGGVVTAARMSAAERTERARRAGRASGLARKKAAQARKGSENA